MNCKKCGTPLVDNDQFCRSCGAPVNQGSAQINYGQSQNNNTLKYILIFLGIAIIAAAIIISVSISSANGEGEGATISKNETETTDKDEENGIKPTAKSTYTVKSSGFTFKIPTDLVYETAIQDGTEMIAIGDEEGTWMVSIIPIQGSYNQLLTNKNQLQSSMIQQGYTASAAVEKTIGGKSFIVLEVSTGGQNALIAYTKANSMYVFALTALSLYNEFDYDILENVAGILNTAEFNAETNNMKIFNELDLSAISELAK